MANGRKYVPYHLSNHYGKFERGFEPDWFEEWRRKRIAAVLKCRQDKERRFVAAVQGIFKDAAPGSVQDARARLEQAQEAGALIGHKLQGDAWLQRRLAAAGFDLAAPARRLAALRISNADAQKVYLWASLLRRSASTRDRVLLDDLHTAFFRWARENDLDRLASRIGPRKLGAWLRADGFESRRSAAGVVFVKVIPPRASPAK